MQLRQADVEVHRHQSRGRADPAEAEQRRLRIDPATRIERRRFELLKRAYVEARYSASYTISADDLEALVQSVRRLRDIVELVSRERLDDLRVQAGM